MEYREKDLGALDDFIQGECPGCGGELSNQVFFGNWEFIVEHGGCNPGDVYVYRHCMDLGRIQAVCLECNTVWTQREGCEVWAIDSSSGLTDDLCCLLPILKQDWRKAGLGDDLTKRR